MDSLAQSLQAQTVVLLSKVLKVLAASATNSLQSSDLMSPDPPKPPSRCLMEKQKHDWLYIYPRCSRPAVQRTERPGKRQLPILLKRC